MFVKFIKNTILFKIIFIMTLTHQTIFAECFYDCCDYCRLFCNCCYSDIITEKDEELTPQILKYLKLDNGKLNDIAVEINNIQDNEEKIKKIIEYSKNIDWENECCPNTLIRWKNNECTYIAYFHLMLNNPYFLKFFFICERINEDEKTVLYEVCQLIKQCINLPNFQKSKLQNPGVTVDKIMDCFYKDRKYEEIREATHPGDRMQYNLALRPMYIDFALIQDIDSLFEFVEKDSPFVCGRKPTFDEYILELEQIAIKLEDNENISSLIKREENSLLGIKVIDISSNHTYAIVKNKEEWFLKDSLKKDKGGKMTVDDVVKLCNKNLDKYKDNKDQTLFFYKLNKCENLESFLKDLEENIPSKSL